MNIRNLLTLLLLSVTAHQQAHGMFSRVLSAWNRAPLHVKAGVVATGVATGLYAAGTASDERRGKDLGFIDVSTPHQPKIVDEFIPDKALTLSVTRQQLENEPYLSYHPLAATYRCANQMGSSYPEMVDSVLFGHFWIFLPTMRHKLLNLVMKMSQDEVEQHNNGNICLVHGTTQGASILLRTIFDEVFNDHTHQNFVKLRDDSSVQNLEQYHNVHEYYDEQIELVPEIEIIVQRRHSGSFRTEKIKRFDRENNNVINVLATNCGFFGFSSWMIHGREQSSAEFVTSACSWMHQILKIAPLVFEPIYLFQIIENAITNPASIKSMHTLIENGIKGSNNSVLFEQIFKEYGVEGTYASYHEELQGMETVAGTGLIHLFIAQDSARRWCYLSRTLGIRRSADPEAICDVQTTNVQNLPWHQARVLMHPDICNPENTSMRFYILGDPAEVSAVIERMYQIAREIKAQSEFNHS